MSLQKYSKANGWGGKKSASSRTARSVARAEARDLGGEGP